MSRMPGEVLMVGSIPLDSADEVFHTCGRLIGPHVSSLPDGEIGERAPWIGFLATHVYEKHPDLETVVRPDFDLPVTSGDNNWAFRVKSGVTDFGIADLLYGSIALESYEAFERAQAEDVIPEHVRFQVRLPLSGSAIYEFFQDAADWDIVIPAYENALTREIDKILKKVPSDKLAIQMDACLEIRDLQGDIPWAPADDKFERAISAAARIAPRIPEDVVLGYHWCYGTLGGWPMVRVDDLGLCVELSNEAVRRSGRRVDYVHMPVPREPDDDYFEPLNQLDVGDAKVYLGLIHHTDGVEGFAKRMDLAERHLSTSYGVASVCGYGRLSPEETVEALRVHRDIADAMDPR